MNLARVVGVLLGSFIALAIGVQALTPPPQARNEAAIEGDATGLVETDISVPALL